MTDSFVCDASVVVAMLLDGGPGGKWATETLAGAAWSAPALLDVEVVTTLRRLELSGQITADQAAQAHRDALDLPVERWPYGLLADRVWSLRATVTAYDAVYVALAEFLDVPLVTLDLRPSRSPGPRCQFRVPPTD